MHAAGFSTARINGTRVEVIAAGSGPLALTRLDIARVVIARSLTKLVPGLADPRLGLRIPMAFALLTAIIRLRAIGILDAELALVPIVDAGHLIFSGIFVA